MTAICQIKQVEYGNGKHQVFVDLPSTIISLKVSKLEQIYSLSIVLNNIVSLL